MLLVGGVAMTACSGSDETAAPAATPAATSATAAPAAPAPLPAGFTTVKGTAYQFGLPTALNFVPEAPLTTADGGVERRWRHAIAPNGPFCVVVAVEQANFTGDFPQSVVALFDAKTQPDQTTIVNKVMSPAPAGAVGGVDQESTFTGTLSDGSTFPSHLYQRKYLTPGRSLVALTVGGPEDQAATCRLPEIITSFSATGQEFTGSSSSGSDAVVPSDGSTGGAS